MKALLKNTHISGAAKAPWLFVLDVEHRAHLITILCLETPCIEIYVTNQFRIYKAQTFLLPVANKIRAKDLKIVYIDQVLIVAATANIVLRGKLIVTSNKNFYQAFHTCYGRWDI